MNIRAARVRLGEMWGLDRALHCSELGRALRLTGRDPGETIHKWESGQREITGPAHVAVEAMLSGWRPAHWRDALRPPKTQKAPPPG